MTPQLKAAVARAIVGGVLTGLLSFLTVLQQQAGQADRVENAGIVGAIALVSYLVARGAAEGIIDSGRAADGDVQPSDVGYSKIVALRRQVARSDEPAA